MLLNRRLVRLKAFQSLYAFFNSKGEISKAQTHEWMHRNLFKGYELYLTYFLFIRELYHYIQAYNAEFKTKFRYDEKAYQANERLLEHPVFQWAAESETLTKAFKNHKIVWNDDSNFLKKAFNRLKKTSYYQQELLSGKDIPEQKHHEAIIQFLKDLILDDEDADVCFEKDFINWEDDKKTVLQVVNKTFKGNLVADELEEREKYLILYYPNKSDEIFEFANGLISHTIENDDYLHKLMLEKTEERWQPKNLAVIDVTLIKMITAELLYFSNIPPKVSINEYVELAKTYGTPNSKKFVNGVVNKIYHDLKDSNAMSKTDRGLLDN